MATFAPSGKFTTEMNSVQDFLAFDEREVFLLPEVVVSPSIPLSAQIGMENAARLRFFNRTGKTAPMLSGGTTDPAVLETLCEACGEAEGKPFEVRYTRRSIHLCPTCAKAARGVAEQLNEMFGWRVSKYPLPVLPSARRK